MATATTRPIGPADHGRVLTAREFLDAEEQPGYRYELARGILEVTRIPSDWHGFIVTALYRAFALYELAHPGVIQRWGGSGEFRIWMPELPTGRHPDAALVLHDAERDAQGRRKPSVVFEVVSEGAEARERDYQAKRVEYLAYGVLEYWLIDRFDRRVTVLTRQGEGWDERVFTGEEPAVGRVLGGFAVRLGELWAAADEGDRDELRHP